MTVIMPDDLAVLATASGPRLRAVHNKKLLHGLALDFLKTQTQVIRAFRQILHQLVL
ncbi:MAG: hypothetical protein V4495_06040 [Pseudomonadota bacterium]